MLISLGAGAQSHRSYDCYRTTGKIKIDGKLDEPDWQAAPRSEAFVDIRGVDFKPAPTKQTYMKMLWDEECLYIAGIIEEDQVTASLTERDAIIYRDNDFEVFIDPGAWTRAGPWNGPSRSRPSPSASTARRSSIPGGSTSPAWNG